MNDNNCASRNQNSRKWVVAQRIATGELSILAVLETAIASAVSIWLVTAWQTWWYVCLTAVLAPLFMLRSSASSKEASERFINYLSRFDGYRDENSEARSMPLFTLYPFLLGASLYFRFQAITRNIKRGSKRIPLNFSVALFRSDLSEEVEFVPGTVPIRQIANEYTEFGDLGLSTLGIICITALIGILFFSIGSWLEIWSPNTSWWWRLLFNGINFWMLSVFVMLPNMTFGYVAFFWSAWIRLSVKSSAIVWLPLVYLAARVPRGKAQTIEAIKDERATALSSLIRVFAWISLILFFWRFLIFPSTYGWWDAQPWAEILMFVILPSGTEPQDISLWHLAAGINAILSLGLFYLFWDRCALRLEQKQLLSENILFFYRLAFWIRGFLSIYSIFCALYFVALGVHFVRVGSIDWCPFPWFSWC